MTFNGFCTLFKHCIFLYFLFPTKVTLAAAAQYAQPDFSIYHKKSV